MTDPLLTHAEAWIRLAGLAIGVLVALAVPVTGFMREYWAHRARMLESERLRVELGSASPAAALGEAADLACALRQVGEAAEALADRLDRLTADRLASDRQADGRRQ